jgi:hypothetical protein
MAIRQISKKRAKKHFKRKGKCPCNCLCAWELRRKWLSKKWGFYLEEEKFIPD